jgi:cobalt/nickel transport system permease protein
MAREPVDPRLALAAALAGLAVAVGSRNVLAPLTVAAAAGVPLLGGEGRSWRRLAPLAPALALGLATALLRAALTPGRAEVAISLAGVTLQLSREGLAAGGLILVRVAAATTIALALAARVPFAHLLAAAAWARVPSPLLEILRIAERQRHALGEAAAQIRAARSLRLGLASARRRFASAGVVAGAVVCRAVDQAGAVATAMELRGSSGLAGVALPPRSPRADLRFVALALPPLTIALAFAALGPSR